MGTTSSNSLWFWGAVHQGAVSPQCWSQVSIRKPHFSRQDDWSRLGTCPNRAKQREFPFCRPWTVSTLGSWPLGAQHSLCTEKLSEKGCNKTERWRGPARFGMTSVEGLHLSLPELLLLSPEPINSPLLKVKFGFQRKGYWLVTYPAWSCPSELWKLLPAHYLRKGNSLLSIALLISRSESIFEHEVLKGGKADP